MHKDHSISIKDALKFGLSVYSCEEVATAYPKVKVLEKGKKTRLGGFLVQPIPLQHSCECYGFLIEHKSIGKLVFCTDTNSVPYRFKDVNHFVIESNYSNEILIDNACNNAHSMSASENHLEINDTIDVLKNNYSSNLMSITLIHLSNFNSNAEQFRQQVQKELGFDNVIIAEKGLEIELKTSEF